jgi:transcriptional regulator with GAF, ATPase, and Fis domain
MSVLPPAGFEVLPELKSLFEISLLSSGMEPLQPYFNAVMTVLTGYFPVGYSALLVREDGKDLLQVEGVFGIPKEAHPLACGSLTGTIGRVLESRQPMVLEDLPGEPLYGEMEAEWDRVPPPLLCVPLVAESRSLGVLNITPLYGSGPKFDRDFRFLGVLAALLSTALLQRQIRWKEDRATSTRAKSPGLEEILEEKLSEVLNRIDPYVESKAGASILDDITRVVERILIRSSLKKVGHVQTAAARLLGINRNTLRSKMKEYKIKAK